VTEFFPGLGDIRFEGPDSVNPLAFRRYEPRKDGERLRFALAFREAGGASGSDAPGGPRARLRAAFELAEKLSVPFICLRYDDEMPRLAAEFARLAAEFARRGPTRLLCVEVGPGGPSGMGGPGRDAAARRARGALELASALGAENCLFEGIFSGRGALPDDRSGPEGEELARLLWAAADYASQIGFSGQLLLRLAPGEAGADEGGLDAAAAWRFLAEFGLSSRFKLEVSPSRAAVAHRAIQSELRFARRRGMLGSVYARWDRERPHENICAAAMTMYEVRKNGGLGRGGIIVSAEGRDIEALAAALIEKLDLVARGDELASRLIADTVIDKVIDERSANELCADEAETEYGGRERLPSLEAGRFDLGTCASVFNMP
jgi:xylose isomerase